MLTSQGGQIFGFDINQSGSDGCWPRHSRRNVRSEQRNDREGLSEDQSPGYVIRGDRYLRGRRGPDQSAGRSQRKDLRKTSVQRDGAGHGGQVHRQVDAPVKDFQVEFAGPNQSTANTAIFGIELKNRRRAGSFPSTSAKNTFGKVIHLDPNTFGVGNVPQVAQDTATNQAVIAETPDGGRVGGLPPINALVNLKTGNKKSSAASTMATMARVTSTDSPSIRPPGSRRRRPSSTRKSSSITSPSRMESTRSYPVRATRRRRIAGQASPTIRSTDSFS